MHVTRLLTTSNEIQTPTPCFADAFDEVGKDDRVRGHQLTPLLKESNGLFHLQGLRKEYPKCWMVQTRYVRPGLSLTWME